MRGSWATLYVQTPMEGVPCLPIAHSLPSTSPSSSPQTHNVTGAAPTCCGPPAPRHNSPGTDVASALIFLTPLCPLTPLSDSVLQGLMTEVCAQSVFLTQKKSQAPALWCVKGLLLPAWPWPCTLEVLLGWAWAGPLLASTSSSLLQPHS